MAGVITLLDQPRTLDALGRATDALIYFYYTNTTVLAPIYNDKDLIDPAVNPIDLAAGEIFPDIFLDPAITYRRRILYGDGTIHDVDPLPVGTGGGEGSLLISVKDFGAIGDGVTDDTAAFQAAFNASDNARLYIPEGDYVISNTITLTSGDVWRGMTLWGDGPSSKVIWKGANNKPMMHFRGISGSAWYSKLIVENFQMYANSFVGDTNTGVGCIQLGDTPEVDNTGVVNPTIRNMLLRHCSYGIRGFYESDEVVITGNYIERFTDYGIYNSRGGSGWWIYNNHLSDGDVNSIPVRTSWVSSIVEDNTIQGLQYLVAVQLDGGYNPTDGNAQASSVSNNYIECGNAGMAYGIIAYGVDTLLIQNNSFRGCSGAHLIALVPLGGTQCTNVVIGLNQHRRSGGEVASLINANSSQTNCQVTAKFSTDGAVSTITGAWSFQNYDGVVQVGQGIQFPATQVSSANANTLDDYEEGTVSLGIRFGATDQTVTSSAGYTKIGRLVTISGFVAMAAGVTGTGGAALTGLPFTSGSLAAGGASAISLSFANVSFSGQYSAYINAASNTIDLLQTAAGGARTQLTHANFASNSEIEFCITYAV